MSTRKAMFFLVLVLPIMSLVAQTVTAQNLVPNGAFSTDLAEWELSTLPNTSITWDSFGNPSGSMRVETTWANPNSSAVAVALSPCVQLSPARYTLRGDVFLQAPNGGCGVNLFFYDNLDCSDNPGNTFILSSTTGVWESQESEFEIFVEEAYRVALFLQIDGSGTLRSCNFDNVSLTGPRNLDVPTLGGWGLIALASALAAGGVVLSLRRRAGL